MNSKAQGLDKALIERQRQRLIKLHEQLVDAAQGEEAEEREAKSQSNGQAEEYDGDAQRLTKLELDCMLIARNLRRLTQVGRVLEQISEGAYGLSDDCLPVHALQEL